MKNVVFFTTVYMLLLASGCSQRITGPGPIDTSIMHKVEEQCSAYFLGIGPFGDSSLKQKPDTIQYTVHNYFFYSTFCTEGYNK